MEMKIFCWLGIHFWDYNRGVIRLDYVSFNGYIRECKRCGKKQYKRLSLFEIYKWIDLPTK